ncbi:hypothetical protein KSS87_012296 [Heliosperma pusillum]|nr:hypothetical protein KSS87_012296 [Heliosperma pusillum]
MVESNEAISMATAPPPSSSRSSLSPPTIPMQLHAFNRDKLGKSLQQHLSINNLPIHGFVLLQGGEEKTRYCTDHAELFRQESYFAYLFGVREPDFYGAIDVTTGKSILFAPRLPTEYAVWLGEIKPLSFVKDKYMVSMTYYVDEMVEVLQNLCNKQRKSPLFLLQGINTDSGNLSKPAAFEGMENFEIDLSILHPILTECRVLKSKMELAVIQYANDISSEAHVEVMRNTKVGMKEYQLESMFLHHTYMYGGCRHCSYTCICATGENSSVLHYGHAAAPNERTFKDGDMALLDMGAEYHFYGSDITCSFPVNGKFTDDQCLVYNAVLDAHDSVIAAMKPGVSWINMHLDALPKFTAFKKLNYTFVVHWLAEKVILEVLKNGSILIGNIEDMMTQRLGAIFMPHGLGHLLGIDTHDPGGYLKGLERSKEPGLKSLRTVRQLEEDMVITVEPGCYFINALLIPAMQSAVTAKFFNRDAISRFEGFGGVRIESDLVVTANGCKNMSNVPRKTWEIEAVMAGGKWPLH